MAYTRVNWKARQGTNLNKFTKSAETPTSVILTNTPDAVTDAGTPVSVENLNIMDKGIADLDAGKAPIATTLTDAAESSTLPAVTTSTDLTALIQAIRNYLKYLNSKKAPLDSPALTGNPTVPTKAVTENSAMAASTAFVHNVLYDRRTVGEVKQMLHAPSTADLIKYRMLPLDGRVIDAATYPDLVARIGTQLPDVRGLFLRAAGASSWYTMANGAPYDGKSIGEFIGDAFQGHWHIMSSTSPVSVTRPSSVFIQRPTSGFALVINVSVPDTGSTELPVKYISDLVNGAPRTAAETRPASIGVYVCITY